VLAPYWPGGRHGRRRCRRDENTTHNSLLASDYRTFLLTKLKRKASAKKAGNGPPTQLIEATSFVKIAIDSKKAEVNSNFSSYQTLTTDNDFVVKLRANEARKKVGVHERQ
jgi:hypothetical protein